MAFREVYEENANVRDFTRLGGSSKLLGRVWSSFSSWCRFSNVEPYQARSEDITLYITDLLKLGYKPITIRNAIYVIIKIVKMPDEVKKTNIQ